ncbi:hypothetical protein [Maribacter sp. 2307ULW6-5]|uniref:hypothetical protein n=1 Tax=Maribacter sp. 2307ULW6-5 TaxID=3386275 RepID=UPI0039BC5C92
MTHAPGQGAALLQNALNDNLYADLIVQLQKDFSRANVPLALEGLEANRVIAAITEKCYVLLMERFEDYLNLMYIIDVPEDVFSNMGAGDVVEASKAITGLILQREFQKVVLKRKYRT